MERVYTNYTASGRQVVLRNVPASFANITVENIRLIFNETQKDEKGEALEPLASTGVKENITNVVYDGTAQTVTITLADTVPAIVSTDKLTIKVDMGDGLEDVDSDLSKITSSLANLVSTTAKDATVAKEQQATLNKEEIIAAIPTECSEEDIDHMFETVTEDGYIIMPSNAVTPEGTLPVGIFTAITGLTPVV